MNKKRIAIFGSTGSIGTQALEVIEANPDLFSIEVLTANNNDDLLIKQALKFNPNVVISSYFSISPQSNHIPSHSGHLSNSTQNLEVKTIPEKQLGHFKILIDFC